MSLAATMKHAILLMALLRWPQINAENCAFKPQACATLVTSVRSLHYSWLTARIWYTDCHIMCYVLYASVRPSVRLSYTHTV